MSNRLDFKTYRSLRTDGKEPSKILKKWCAVDDNEGGVPDLMRQFDFKSQAEIEEAVRFLIHTATTRDKVWTDKNKRQAQPNAIQIDILLRQAMNLRKKVDDLDKYAGSIARNLWYTFFSRELQEDRRSAMFNVSPSRPEFERTAARIKDLYSLTDLDIVKLQFFVEQTKAGGSFPPSLRRMLYLWSDEKGCGKSTTARAMTCVLNGDGVFDSFYKYETTLKNEMQIAEFSLPKIAEVCCACMDECFYADMSKTYNSFKSMMTTIGGKARMPYGQSFEWTGYPNYISTSNEPLSTFIKDWGDRRFLEINMHTPKVRMSFDDIIEMWRSFCVNCTKPEGLDFDEWAGQIRKDCEAVGEMQVVADEWQSDMLKPPFLEKIISLPPQAPKSNSDKVTEKTVRRWMADLGDNDHIIDRERKQIRRAFEELFGKKANAGGWYLSDLKKKAEILLANNGNGNDNSKTELPF